ncbi:T-complex 11 [Dillenia turbinata]|uniref:T-complex 11 n=1 Tax=Dillenia turbinata TaxID=194707 RepID=A0AAN8UHH9_9MAGN
MRLAYLDKLRQAARTGVEMRFEEEREKLSTKMESRVLKAEANRMLLLKAYKQRRATLKERSAQSLLRRISGAIKYKERECAPIQQKRAAAESKRLGLLEAEKKRAHARVLQVRQVARSVYSQREADRRRMKDQGSLKFQTCKMTSEGETDIYSKQGPVKQHQRGARPPFFLEVTEDQKLLRDRVQHLSGDAGIERGRKPNKFSSYTAASAVSGIDVRNNVIKSSERPSRVVRFLFRDDAKEVVPSATGSSSKSQLDTMITENELIVNEVLHEQQLFLADNIDISENDANNIKHNNFTSDDWMSQSYLYDTVPSVFQAKIRKTMEKAFWDGIIESVEQDEPRYDRVIELMREVRDEICEFAPESWKQDIMEAIDLDILSQFLRSGNLDIDYLGKILQFALVMLQKLSAPASEDEMQKTGQELMKELAEICETSENSKKADAIAMIKGLRFLLEQIQVLKWEISRARIRLMEPLLKSQAGRHGSPSDCMTSLPLTLHWLSHISNGIDHEWDEHRSSIVDLGPSFGSSTHGLLPSTTMRSGGSMLVKTNGSSISGTTHTTGEPQPECNGEMVDLLLRLGLLKLVSGVSGLTKEVLPETLELNLQTVQAEIQKIIVISTSCLSFVLTESEMRFSSSFLGVLLLYIGGGKGPGMDTEALPRRSKKNK